MVRYEFEKIFNYHGCFDAYLLGNFWLRSFYNRSVPNQHSRFLDVLFDTIYCLGGDGSDCRFFGTLCGIEKSVGIQISQRSFSAVFFIFFVGGNRSIFIIQRFIYMAEFILFDRRFIDIGIFLIGI